MSRRLAVSRAFTLVELLVVIAMIVLLAALLLPGLRGARDRAKETACSSNIRQIYTLCAVYGNDNNQYLPAAWYITERMWTGWSYQPFLHNYLAAYLSPRSKLWFDPGWSADQNYYADAGWTCVGTPDNPGAGNVPFTPANAGCGYYYICWASSLFWYNASTGVDQGGVLPGTWNRGDIQFSGPRNPYAAKILSCMPGQQAPLAGDVGPHQRGTAWSVLWLDGHQSPSRGVWGSPSDGQVYVNYAGSWCSGNCP